MSQVLQLWSERIAAAAASGAPLCLRGAGTKSFYGNASPGEVLDTRAHCGIVNYEPSELVLTARCGTTLLEIENTLAAQGQMLGFEPPHFGDDATLGGCISAGLSGPRRASAGALRDFVLGVQLIDGRGELLNFGGQVMKNVAGYDVSRLLCGALGTLGLLAQISLKVLPRPVAELTLQFELGEAAALANLIQWRRLPLPLSASAFCAGSLLLRLSGAASAVAAARQQLGGEIVPVATAAEYWLQLREQRSPFFTAEGTPLWRLSVPATASALQLPGSQTIEWYGALRWLRTDATASVVRAAAAAAGGHATWFRGAGAAVEVFTPLPAPLLELHRRLKHSFDPQRIFNRGRLYADL